MPGTKGGAIRKKVMGIKHKYLSEVPEQFRDIEAISFGKEGSLMVSFHGFENRDDMKEFCEYLFSRIRMDYYGLDKAPTIH